MRYSYAYTPAGGRRRGQFGGRSDPRRRRLLISAERRQMHCHVLIEASGTPLQCFAVPHRRQKVKMAAIGGVSLARQATGASIPPALSALSKGGRLSCLRFPVRGVRCSAAPEVSSADAPASQVSGGVARSPQPGHPHCDRMPQSSRSYVPLARAWS